MIMDANGNLYGTTAYDGADGLGTVFKLSTDGHGGYLYTDLHDFTGDDGEYPGAPLIMDQEGNLYGSTVYGGDFEDCEGLGCGVVFEITGVE